MPKFSLRLELYVQYSHTVELDASNLEAALSTALESAGEDWDAFCPELETASNPRAYIATNLETGAKVSLSDVIPPTQRIPTDDCLSNYLDDPRVAAIA